MKLSELIFESQILLEDKFEIRKNPNGRTWGVYNTTVTPNVLISSHKTKNQANIKADQLRNPTPPKPKDTKTTTKSSSGRNSSPRTKTPAPTAKAVPPNVKLAPGMFQTDTNRWKVVMPDGKSIVTLNDGDDAARLQKYIEQLEAEGKKPKDITNALKKKQAKFLKNAGIDAKSIEGKIRNNPISRKITSMTLDEFKKGIAPGQQLGNTKIGRWVQSSNFAAFSGKAGAVVGKALAALMLFYGISFALAQVEAEIIETGDPDGKLAEEYSILQGQAVIQFGIFAVTLLKDIKSIKILTSWVRAAIKIGLATIGTGVGAVGGAVVGTGVGPVGTIAGGAKGALAGNRAGRILGIIAGQGLDVLFYIVVSLPPVQRLVAQILQNSWLGDYFGYLGQGFDFLLKAADESLAGAFGTGFLADKLTIEQTINKGPDGEYFSESEWAKKVFGALLFPKGDKTKFVPYMPQQKREDLLNSIMTLEQKDTSQDAADTAISNKMDSDNAAAQPQPATV